ncbi:MAG: M20 family metallopeptidase [Thermomicrobiales bacterium]|nr:M20 family metallopeptidase [Thermomicrobiales bacterium]
MTSEAQRQNALDAIDRHAAELRAVSQFIHDHPEIALEEVESSNAAADILEKLGFDVERGIAGLGTAFRATAGSDDGPHIAFLAEYDALPGVGHGCGHNLIALSALAAGVGARSALEGRHGRITVFGTPAEEAVGGKVIMKDAGIFDDVDAAMGAHPGDAEAWCPTVPGSGEALACQGVTIAFRGQAAHAAADPFNGINALDGIILTFNGINALRQHVKSDARLHGIIVKGGDAANVIPDYAEAFFFVRAATQTYMYELVEKVRRIAEGAALMTGATLEFSFPEPASWDMITNYTLANALKANIDRVGLALPEAKAQEANGSTDWGNVSYTVPSVETAYPIINRVCTWHSQDVVDAAESELGYGNTFLVAKAMALTAIDLIENPETLTAIKTEFTEARDRRIAAR